VIPAPTAVILRAEATVGVVVTAGELAMEEAVTAAAAIENARCGKTELLLTYRNRAL